VTTPLKGRGSSERPTGRFENFRYEPDPGEITGEKTQVIFETAKTILAWNDSPDIGFQTSLNPYRGCEHGCAYCYARPTHEYLGYSAGLDFETKLIAKKNAPELLRKELASRSYVPSVIAISGVTDAYQPIERKLELTRRCLEVLAECRNPIAIITKNHLVTRDIDLLRSLAEVNAVTVYISVTSLDAELASKLEPRASRPVRRLAAIRELSEAGIPVGVLMAPVIPGLTEHEISGVLTAAAENGARTAAYVPLRLPFGLDDLFTQWLETHAPLKKDKVLNRVRAMRGGKLNDPNFGSRMRGSGFFAEQMGLLFKAARKKAGLTDREINLSTSAFRAPPGPQLELF